MKSCIANLQIGDIVYTDLGQPYVVVSYWRQRIEQAGYFEIDLRGRSGSIWSPISCYLEKYVAKIVKAPK